MATTFCNECKLFKEEFESLDGSGEVFKRAPFPNLVALKDSALSGCSLCQIIFQSWHYNKDSARFQENTPFEVVGFLAFKDNSENSDGDDSQHDSEDNYEPNSQRLSIWQHAVQLAFSLGSLNQNGFGIREFGEHQKASRQVIDLGAPGSIDKVCSLALKWIRNCDKAHERCGEYHANSEPKIIPTRLIDVGTDNHGQPPRLFIPQRHLRSLKYVALSYAWGSAGNNVKTTSSNLTAMTQCLPWSQLPKTIQDAIVITRGLGVRYLWVDALCILQSEGHDDTKHKEDWAYEAARFGQYYENSLLTIAATGASSSDDGLFLPRPALRFEPESITFRPEEDSSYTIRPIIPSWHTEMYDAPLLRRGWAVQERMISRRVLHFAKNMVLWECHDCRATELDTQGLRPIGPEGAGDLIPGFAAIFRDIRTGGLLSDDFVSEWYHFLTQYSHQNFSFVSDRLPALSGIASIIQHRTQQKYVAGMWESAIPEGLAWMTDHQFRYNTSNLLGSGRDESKEASSQVRLPSWCWAASRSSATFISSFQWASVLQVEAWKLESQGMNTSGQILRGRLTVRSLFGTLNLSNLGFVFHPSPGLSDHVLERDPVEHRLEHCQMVCMDTAMDPQLRYLSHPCIFVGVTKALDRYFKEQFTGGAIILEATGRCTGAIQEYRRIGFICFLLDEAPSIFEKWETIDLV
ncbi:heterokaryon incompatibility protein-domain-containing protein [Fusarium avenaceum]|nr:heterokaryon incompatibility protein-domain-containing protein [Fusarium avenaceum]